MIQRGRIAAVCVQMDSWPLLYANILHLVSEGITDFYVMNHACEHDLRSVFEERLGDKANFFWFKKSTAPFFQAGMTTFLVNRVKKEGFEVALVFDSDEFFTTVNPEETLTSAILWEISGVSHLRVFMLDYQVQERFTVFGLESLDSSRVHPNPNDLVIKQWANGGHTATVSLKRPGKTIINLQFWRKNSFVTTGNHYSQGRGKASQHVRILHLPFWSLGSIQQRVRHGHNLNRLNGRNGFGLHSKSFDPADHLTAWSQNTYVPADDTPMNETSSPETNQFKLITRKIENSFPPKILSFGPLNQPNSTTQACLDVSSATDSAGPKLLYREQSSLRGILERTLRLLRRLRVKISSGESFDTL